MYCLILCLDCSLVDCPLPICARGYEPFTPEGECCQTCRRGKYTFNSIPSKLDVSRVNDRILDIVYDILLGNIVDFDQATNTF